MFTRTITSVLLITFSMLVSTANAAPSPQKESAMPATTGYAQLKANANEALADPLLDSSPVSVRGNGTLKAETRPLTAFSHINLQNNINIQLLHNNKTECTVRTDSNLLPYIVTSIKDGVLFIRSRDNAILNSAHDIVVTVNTQTLSAITHNGSGDIDGHNMVTDKLAIVSHGSGDVRLDGKLSVSRLDVTGSGDVQLDNVVGTGITVSAHGESDIEMRGDIDLKTVRQSGQGDIVIKGINSKLLSVLSEGSGDARLLGKTDLVTLQVNGSADVNASQLTSTTAFVEVMGSGDIMVKATKKLGAKVLGSGDITYYGSPKAVDINILGTGRVHSH